METPHSPLPGKPPTSSPFSWVGETGPLHGARGHLQAWGGFSPPLPPPREGLGVKDSHTMSPLTLVSKSGLGAMETSLGSREGKQQPRPPTLSPLSPELGPLRRPLSPSPCQASAPGSPPHQRHPLSPCWPCLAAGIPVSGKQRPETSEPRAPPPLHPHLPFYREEAEAGERLGPAHTHFTLLGARGSTDPRSSKTPRGWKTPSQSSPK